MRRRNQDIRCSASEALQCLGRIEEWEFWWLNSSYYTPVMSIYIYFIYKYMYCSIIRCMIYIYIYIHTLYVIPIPGQMNRFSVMQSPFVRGWDSSQAWPVRSKWRPTARQCGSRSFAECRAVPRSHRNDIWKPTDHPWPPPKQLIIVDHISYTIYI